MKRVVIESPFKGATATDEAMHVSYAQQCLLDSLVRGEAPFASHLLYTQVLDDQLPEDRRRGIEAGLRAVEGFELTAVYLDWGLSEGMKIGVRRAGECCRPADYRFLYKGTMSIEEEGALIAEANRHWMAGQASAEPVRGRLIAIPKDLGEELVAAREACETLESENAGDGMRAALRERRALLKLGEIVRKGFSS